MPFEFERLEIEGLILIRPKVFGDNRGVFMEIYKKSEFIKNGINVDFVQDNCSKSSKCVLRGLHYQANPKQQAKLIRCLQGKIYDIAVDLRKNSKTFGEWLKVELSDDNNHMLFIPEGFAHGFVVLSDGAQLLYKASAEYSPELERGLLWNDSKLNINWGIDFEPLLSEKDQIQPTLDKINKEELL